MSSNNRSLLINSLDLPRIETINDLAKLTGVSTRLLYCLSKKTKNYYKTKFIPKRDGSRREIFIPSYTLHIIQRWILVNILDKVLPSNRAMAFRRGKFFGHKKNAAYHSYTLYGLSIDLKDFFPSITSDKVYTLFSDMGYNSFSATILTNLCTLNGVLPQGSSCSPAISNLICITLDKRLIGLCEKRGIRFTRYADDMYFSCDDKILLLKNLATIVQIILSEGFDLNDKKTHFHTPSNRKRVTGVTIVSTKQENTFELKAPKELKRKIRAEIYKCVVSGIYDNRDHILGEIAYVGYIEKENINQYLPKIKKYIERTASKIKFFPELVDAYNSNLFFKDIPPVTVEKIEIKDEKDQNIFSQMFEERKSYLIKNDLKDICNNYKEHGSLEKKQ